jgi:hypothetical protein
MEHVEKMLKTTIGEIERLLAARRWSVNRRSS